MKLSRLQRIVQPVLAALALTGLCGTSVHAAEVLNVYNWSDYIDLNILKKFEAETGIRVTLDTYDSGEAMLAKLEAGADTYDIVFPPSNLVKIMIDKGLLQKIETSKLSNFKNIVPPFNKPYADPPRDFTVPYLWGTTSFAYDSSRVPGGKLPETWKTFFEPPAVLRGQIVALDDQMEVFVAAAHYLGIDQCTEDPKDHQRILDVLLKQKPHLLMYSSVGTIERLQAGEVIGHHIWSGAENRAAAKRKTLVYMYPEKVNFWLTEMAVPKRAKNVENAKKFLNFMMQPENIAMASNFAGYNNTINGSLKLMREDLQNNPAVNPPLEIRSRFVPLKGCSAKSMELRNRSWTKLKR